MITNSLSLTATGLISTRKGLNPSEADKCRINRLIRVNPIKNPFLLIIQSTNQPINPTLITDFDNHLTKVFTFEKANKRARRIFKAVDDRFFPFDFAVGDPFTQISVKLR